MSCQCGHEHAAHNLGTWALCGGDDCCGRWCCLIFCPCVGICYACTRWRDTDCACQLRFTPAEGEGWLSGYGLAIKNWIELRASTGDSIQPETGAGEGWADINVHSTDQVCSSCYHTCHKARGKCKLMYNYNLPFLGSYHEPVSGGSHRTNDKVDMAFFPAKAGQLPCNCVECFCANCCKEKGIAVSVRCPCAKCTCPTPHRRACTCCP